MPRLLFDEPLSERLCELLADLFPDSLHVRRLGLSGADDTAIWNLARERDCMIVSKDGDFHRLAMLRGAPPKFIWIKIGNCRTADIVELLRLRQSEIFRFQRQNETTVIELG